MPLQSLKQIPITNLLTKLGYNPKKTRGHEYWYLSPFRKEDTPSFKVDTKQNIWYDHGSKQGGSIVDLVMQMKNYTLADALEELSNIIDGSQNMKKNTPKRLKMRF